MSHTRSSKPIPSKSFPHKLEIACVNVGENRYRIVKSLKDFVKTENPQIRVSKCLSHNQEKFYVAKEIHGPAEELKILQTVQSSKVIKLIDSYSSPELTVLLMESGEVNFEYLIQSNHINTEKMWQEHYFSQILNSILFIHNKKIAHLDLKPENFVLVAGTLKLIDFGCSEIMNNDEPVHIFEACGTLEYMSPERVEKRGPAFIISLKADIWSLGCILYKIKTADTPFKSVDQIIDSHVKFGPEFSAEDKNFISRCLKKDFNSRPTIQELFFSQ